MKTLLASLVVAVSSVVAIAQQPRERQPRQLITPPPADHANVGAQMGERQLEELDENVTLKITGKAPGGTPIDFAMTGAGPDFRLDQPAGEHESIGHHYQIRKINGTYRVSCGISLRMRVETGRHGDTVNYQFRDLALHSTVFCRPGKPVVIAKSGGNELKLVIEETGTPSEDVVEEVDVEEESADVVEEVDVEPADEAQE